MDLEEIWEGDNGLTLAQGISGLQEALGMLFPCSGVKVAWKAGWV